MVARKVDFESRARPSSSPHAFRAPGRVRRWDGRAIRFVEDKPLDMRMVDDFLTASRRANQWSNFGPVARQLEREIELQLGLSPELRVVMCCSGTAALHALIGMHTSRVGRPLRWVTSSFGFYCTIQGPLAEAAVVDCDAYGMLDLDLVDPTQFDGIIVTNIFGGVARIDEYVDFARRHGLRLVVDSALSFGSHPHGPNEFISFHHTKPWGFGEGGCAIVAADDEADFRSIISLGHEPGQDIDRHASNYKASDVQCAFQLMRLHHMTRLAPQYGEQYRRIVQIGLRLGIGVLGDLLSHPSIPGSVPFQLPAPLADVRTPSMPTGRYYHPLADTPVAQSIYERMVNVPCHPGMAVMDDDALHRALVELRDRCNRD